MHLTTIAGRTALLDFFRNLTPQVLIMSTAIYFYVQWQIDSGNLDLFVFVILSGICALLVFSNMDAFLGAYFKEGFGEPDWLIAEREKWDATKPGLARRLWNFTTLIAKRNPIAFVEIFAALVIIYGASWVVINAAVMAVVRMYS